MNWIKRSQTVLQKTLTHTQHMLGTPLLASMSVVCETSKRKRKNIGREKTSCLRFLTKRKETGIDLDQMEEEAQSNLDTVYDILEEDRNELKRNDLAFLSGPVTSDLDNVLEKNKLQCRRIMGVHLSATIAINISNHLSHMMSAKVLWRKRFS